MSKKRLFVDMDGTLARFHDQANYLERMFEKNFFRDLNPFENMVNGVREFIRMHPDVEVYVLSAKVNGEPPYCAEEKHAWLDKHLPEIPRERRIFTDMGRRKAEYIPGDITKDDYLLDDYNKGLHQFMYDGGSCIKCHNNINQKGLGVHGGQRGNLWIGSMVHTADKPELIAAEISSHMGLPYDLDHVYDAYPEVETRNFNYSNPLNDIRQLAGDTEFREVILNYKDQYRIPEHLLASICTNLYGSPYLSLIEVDSRTLYKDVKHALKQAQSPIIGQIDVLTASGDVQKNTAYYSFEEMQKEIELCKERGQPIDVHWNIEPSASRIKKPTLSSLIQNAKHLSGDGTAPGTPLREPIDR